jgi:flagellar biosynthetic protein FliR
MTAVIDALLTSADYFILMCFRVGGLVVPSPIFGRTNVPVIARLGLVASIGFLFYTVFPQTVDITHTTLIGFALACALELLLGMALAFVTNVFFSLTAFTAGQLIDMQIGFGIVNVYDIQNNTQVPMMGNILNLMMLLVFFSVDGPHRLIELVYLTVEGMPIGTLMLSAETGWVALELFARAFLLGVMMALPILASGLTLEIAFGVMMRAVPQIHMFVVGIPMKMLIGMFVFMFTLPVFGNYTALIFSELYSGIGKMFATFSGA